MKIKCSALIIYGFFCFHFFSFVSYDMGVLVPEGGDAQSRHANRLTVAVDGVFGDRHFE